MPVKLPLTPGVVSALQTKQITTKMSSKHDVESTMQITQSADQGGVKFPNIRSMLNSNDSLLKADETSLSSQRPKPAESETQGIDQLQNSTPRQTCGTGPQSAGSTSSNKPGSKASFHVGLPKTIANKPFFRIKLVPRSKSSKASRSGTSDETLEKDMNSEPLGPASKQTSPEDDKISPVKQCSGVSSFTDISDITDAQQSLDSTNDRKDSISPPICNPFGPSAPDRPLATSSPGITHNSDGQINIPGSDGNTGLGNEELVIDVAPPVPSSDNTAHIAPPAPPGENTAQVSPPVPPSDNGGQQLEEFQAQNLEHNRTLSSGVSEIAATVIKPINGMENDCKPMDFEFDAWCEEQKKFNPNVTFEDNKPGDKKDIALIISSDESDDDLAIVKTEPATMRQCCHQHGRPFRRGTFRRRSRNIIRGGQLLILINSPLISRLGFTCWVTGSCCHTLE